MAFSQMLEILKEKEKGTIVFVKLGTFYIAVGEDAVLMHKKLELKCTCFKMNICKVGFPVVALEKYIEYVLSFLIKLPRIEKFNIGNEYKISVYNVLKKSYIHK